MDGWQERADLEMSRMHPKRYAAPRMPEPPEPVQPPAEDRRQLPRTLHVGRYPIDDVTSADGWIRSLRYLVCYRGLAVDERRCHLADRHRQVGPVRRAPR